MSPVAKGFRQTTSFLKRQSWIIAFVLFAFFLQSAGVFLSSTRLVQGLTEINRHNQLFTETNQAADAITSAAETLAKVKAPIRVEDLSRVFEAHMQAVRSSLSSAISLLEEGDGTRAEIVRAQVAVDSFRNTAGDVFRLAEAGKSSQPELNTQLLLGQQFQLEANEALRKIQIAIRKRNTEAFESTYQMRHLPLVTAVVLAILASAAILLVSLYANNRIRRSVGALLLATDEIAQGNLRYRAPILEEDEVGRLAYAVNEMVSRLELSQDRTERLQTVTAAFSEALSQEAVAGVVMRLGLSALEADAAVIALLDEESRNLTILQTEGYDPESLRTWSSFSVDMKAPLAEAVRSRNAIWIESQKELLLRYPEIPLHEKDLYQSFVAIPLMVAGRAVGAMGLSYTHIRKFSREEQAFSLSLARQCAQALNRAELYDQAQQAVRLRDEFLSIASHELRTPLTPLKIQIQGLSRMISRQQVVSEQQGKLERMMVSANAQVIRITRLVDELLDVTRIGAGKLTLEYSKIDLSRLVQEVTERFTPELSKIHPSVRLELEPDLVGTFDPFRMEQVLTNLLTNAMRYGPGKPLEIRTRRLPGDIAQLEVRDEGMGIAPEDQKRIFGRFERAASSLHYGGLGLGLYITQQIVERHHGKIQVESEVGTGSRFVVTLPLQQAAAS